MYIVDWVMEYLGRGMRWTGMVTDASDWKLGGEFVREEMELVLIFEAWIAVFS